jgi:hypothetical protein
MSEVQTTPNLESDKEVLRDILSDREYTSYYTAAAEGRSWIRRVWDYIAGKLADLLPDTALPQSAADLMAYAVLLAGLVLLVFLLIWIGRRIAFDRRLSRRIGLSKEELAYTYADYLRQAGSAVTGGEAELQEGVRAVLLAFLFYADHRRWLKVEQWKSNGEYAMELRTGKQEIQPLFAEAARLFDEVWYGKGAARPDELERLYRSVSQLIAVEEGRHEH